ncbi:hypothetical protein [Streptomyces avermitilis]|uniref:hypothetical protein n=1 Tax=Streptomyces avermitilis TaxID=33903 RepID=UPI0038062164
MSRVQGRPRRVRRAVGVLTTLAVLGMWEAAGRSGSVMFLEPFSVAARGAWDLVSGPGLRQDVLPSARNAVR